MALFKSCEVDLSQVDAIRTNLNNLGDELDNLKSSLSESVKTL